MSGVDVDGRRLRKGAADSFDRGYRNKAVPSRRDRHDRRRHRRAGGTPLTVAENDRVLGVIYLKDIVKEGMRQRFDELRRMGIRTVMITGDNPRTAEAIASEAGVDDFLAEATPEDKMALIRSEQAGGKLVAMTGDGTNDAPALAQADVGVAMNTGTSAAKEAGNMVDLDSNPTKVIEIVGIGKQLLITRIAHDLLDRQRRREVLRDHPRDVRGGLPGARPASTSCRWGARVRRSCPRSSSRPDHRGVDPARAEGSATHRAPRPPCLRRNLGTYGLGGVIAPFIGIRRSTSWSVWW
jgi:K+-transporting ATPase ATPase B chain